MLRQGLGTVGSASNGTAVSRTVDDGLRQAMAMGTEAALQTQNSVEQLVGVIGAQTQALMTLTSRLDAQMQGSQQLAQQMSNQTETLRQAFSSGYVHLTKSGQAP